MDTLFANRLEIAGTREFREARFQCVLIKGMAFAQRDTAAHEAIVEFVKTLELEAMDKIRGRVAESELE